MIYKNYLLSEYFEESSLLNMNLKLRNNLVKYLCLVQDIYMEFSLKNKVSNINHLMVLMLYYWSKLMVFLFFSHF